MTHKERTIAITGAAGQISYALLFRIASGQMFGPHTRVNLHLIELESSLPALQGVVMELEDGAFPLLQRVRCTADPYEGMAGVNWALLIGAAPRRQGMERSDLLSINGALFQEQGRAINAAAADDVNVLVVGNPCNTNALITMHHAPDVPRERFFAMTMLDELRARSQLAIRSGQPISSIKRMVIWGNHSSTQYPDFYHASIGDRSVLDVIADETWLQQDFIAQVQKRGAAVIQARGASSAASAANAVLASVVAVEQDTPVDEYFSLARCSQGEYGVTEGLIYSYPCRSEGGQLQVVAGLEHHAFAQQQLKSTEQELLHERQIVANLDLLG